MAARMDGAWGAPSQQPPLPPPPAYPGHAGAGGIGPHGGAQPPGPPGLILGLSQPAKHQPTNQPAMQPPAQPPKEHRDKHRERSGSHSHKPSSQHPPAGKKPAAGPPAPTPALHKSLDTRLRRDTPFLASIRFKNDLPEVPVDPKLLITQLPPDRLAAFSLTSLEVEPQRELVLPSDLGISLSLLDPERYVVPDSKPTLHPADQALLGTDAEVLLLPAHGPRLPKPMLGVGSGSPVAGPRRVTALRTAGEVSWLMRTTYITAEAEARKQAAVTEAEAKRKQQEVTEEADEEAQRQEQIRVIEATFAAAREPPVHRTKPGMRAVEVLEVLPDEEWWGGKQWLVNWDADPATEVDELTDMPPDTAHEVVGRSFMVGFRAATEPTEGDKPAGARPGDDAGSRSLALVLPFGAIRAGANAEPRPADGDVQGDYKWAKEYTFTKAKDAERGGGNAPQHYLVRLVPGKALYSVPGSTLELRRRTASTNVKKPSKVVISKRPPSARELADQRARKRALYAVAGEVDEEGYEGTLGEEEIEQETMQAVEKPPPSPMSE